ncbi:MAG: DinB family protein [Gemmatimonadaceae bacterium]
MMTNELISTVPDHSEAADYYFTYIDQVPKGDIREILRTQLPEIVEQLKGISEEKSLYRYEPGKWSIREVVSHVNDGERVFAARAFWFARGFDSPLPGFDQEIGVAGAHADERSFKSHIEEFEAVRKATLAFVDSLTDEAWNRRGIASDNPFSVRALVYTIAGHATHHMKVLKRLYA